MRELKLKIWIAYLLALSIIPSCGNSKSGNYKNDKSETIQYDSLKVIGIIDGDTYDLLKGKETIRIRVDAIDAPEKGMPYYKVSKKFLSDLIFGKYLHVNFIKKDHHDRFVASAKLSDGRDVSTEMIKAGLAWHYKEFSNDEILSNLELEARKNKIGLWQDPNAYPPWEIRKLHRQGISTKDSFTIRD